MRVTRRQAASLRTKTGCFSCRERRKKCDEQRPRCTLCTKTQRECTWPSSKDMQDRRNLPRRGLRAGSLASNKHSEVSYEAIINNLQSQANLTSSAVEQSLETAVGRHFIERYYPSLLNSESHPDFHRDWLQGIQDTTTSCTSLYYSVLANAASNIFISTGHLSMGQRALVYYSRSLRDLTKLVSKSLKTSSEPRTSVLQSAIFLYLNGCMGLPTTYDDIPSHLHAATKLLNQEFFQADPPRALLRPSHVVIVESVIYQIFLVRMHLWSQPLQKGLSFDFDPLFWLNCEALLARSKLFPGAVEGLSSPVLGMDFVLYKIYLMIRALWASDRTTPGFQSALSQLIAELAPWEALLCARDSGASHNIIVRTTSIFEDAQTLFTLGASLLISQLPNTTSDSIPSPPEYAEGRISQISSILRRRAGDDRWSKSHLPNYPIYVIGFFMRTQEEIQLVRHEFHERSRLLAWSMIDRYWRDLDLVWLSRSP